MPDTLTHGKNSVNVNMSTECLAGAPRTLVVSVGVFTNFNNALTFDGNVTVICINLYKNYYTVDCSILSKRISSVLSKC